MLLQTAQAFVCRPDNPEIGLNAHMIFDSCSQRSYITSMAREQLNLTTVGEETNLIKTSGDHSASIKECDVMKLCVRTLDGLNVHVTSYVVPVIYSSVRSNQQTQDTLECYPYRQILQFAQSYEFSNIFIRAGKLYFSRGSPIASRLQIKCSFSGNNRYFFVILRISFFKTSILKEKYS